MDPELAMALRMSLEEERARQERVSFKLKLLRFAPVIVSKETVTNP